VIFISLFGAVGAVHMILSYLTSTLFPLKVVAAVCCFLVAIYGGVLFSYIRALPLWNTGLLPATYITAGFWGGAELLLGILLLTGGEIGGLELWIRVLLPFFALLVLLYLISIPYASQTGMVSVRRILLGDLAPYFYPGVVLIGLLFPLIVLGYSLSVGAGSVAPSILLAAIAAGLIGDLTMRYCIMKAALYAPIIGARGVEQ
jgi:formate-dependent nitrite reductase membrane component NrfD